MAQRSPNPSWRDRLDRVLGNHARIWLAVAPGRRNVAPSEDADNRGRSPRLIKGFFTAASRFIVYKPKMVEKTYITATPEAEVTSWQEHHILRDVSFDAFALSPSKCHSTTRIQIRGTMESHFNDPYRFGNLLWIIGPAGAGKTAIMRTVAETEASKTKSRLGATVFFSREKDCYPRWILPTIAYQLSLRDKTYQTYISKLRTEDPEYFAKDLDTQFKKLFVTPHLRYGLFGDDSPPWIIMLDGLDECLGDSREAEPDFQRAQCAIVKLISTFVRSYPSASLVWVIASRPERHLSVLQKKIVASCVTQDIHIDSLEAVKDVRWYLLEVFREVRDKYPYQVPSSETTWPNEDDLRKVADAASGFFMFASAVVGFVENRNPVANLKYVLSAIEQPSSLPETPNPFALLDSMYTQILDRVPQTMIADTKRLLACSMFRSTSYPLQRICNILGVEQSAIYAALEDLYSVLDIPPPDSARERNIKFFHSSFCDYLLDMKRSKHHGISIEDLEDAARRLWQGYLRILKQAAQNGGQDVTLAWPGDSFEEISTQKGVLTLEARGCWVSSFSNIAYRENELISLEGIENLPINLHISDLCLVLQEIEFDSFSQYLPAEPDWIPNFIDQLTQLYQRYPKELKDIMELVPLQELDLERIFFDQRLSFGPRLEIDRSLGLNDYHSSTPYRRYLKGQSASTPVLLLGAVTSTRCALLKVEKAPPPPGALTGIAKTTPFIEVFIMRYL